MAITFTSDAGQLGFNEYWKAGKMLEAYFQTEADANQAPITKQECRWILANMPECANVILDNKKVVGITFFFPTSSTLMKRFLDGKISEHTLWEQTKRNIHQRDNDCLYMASAFVDSDYRGKGLALTAFRKSIQRYSRVKGITPKLYFWGYSPEGKRLAHKTAREMRLKIIEKKVRPAAKRKTTTVRKRPSRRP